MASESKENVSEQRVCCRSENSLSCLYKKLKFVHYMQMVVFWLCAICWVLVGQNLSGAFYNRRGVFECVLFANWTLVKKNDKYFLSDRHKIRGSNLCEMVMFGFVGIAVIMAILGWMFLVISPNRQEFIYRRVSRASDLIPMSGVVSVGALIFAVYAGVRFEEGFAFWCSTMEDVLPSCDRSVEIRIGTRTIRPVFTYFLVAEVFMWIGLVLCVVELVFVVLRVVRYMDFPPVPVGEVDKANSDSFSDSSIQLPPPLQPGPGPSSPPPSPQVVIQKESESSVQSPTSKKVTTV